MKTIFFKKLQSLLCYEEVLGFSVLNTTLTYVLMDHLLLSLFYNVARTQPLNNQSLLLLLDS